MSESQAPRRRRRLFPVLFVTGLAVLVVIGAVGVFVWKFALGGQEHTKTLTESHGEPVTRLEVEGNSGAVEIVESSGDETTVETRLRWRGDERPGQSQKLDGETLRLRDTGCEHSGIMGPDCDVTWRIELPADADVDVTVDSGQISTTGIKGEQKLHTDSGGIDVVDAGEKLVVTGDSGKLDGRGLPGTEVEADLDSGAIELDFSEVPDRVTAAADTGEVRIRVPHSDDGYDVNTKTGVGSGDVNVDTDPDSGHRIDATTGSGRISVDYSLRHLGGFLRVESGEIQMYGRPETT